MPQDYIDTQGLSPKLSPEEAAKLKDAPREYKPMLVKPSRLFTETYVKEMNILINDCLLYTSKSPREISTSRMK